SAAVSALQHDLESQAAKLELDREKLETQQQFLENRAKEVDKRADDLEHLISEMTIGSGVYTLLLGLFAFFGLKGAASEADRYLATLKEQVETSKKGAQEEGASRQQEFEEFKRAIRNDIPSLYGMQRALGLLLDRIRRQVDLSLVWTRSDPYNNMSEEQRQTIILAEMTVAAFDYFRLDSSDMERGAAAQIFADLANFYSARARVNPNKYNPSDMRRALIYLDRAHQMDRTNARILAQRGGFILSDTANQGASVTQDQLDAAEHDLRECLRIDPSNVRALYNLAWIADERSKFPEAVDLLTQVIDRRDTLPQVERGRRMIAAFINRACARSKISATVSGATERQKMDEQVFEDCKKAVEEADLYNERPYAKQSLERELLITGELHHMATMTEMQTLLQSLS
ncbi:MAG: hypothetical protein QOE55_3357, partial [Acidobacteriaceae bacterium]|nr:hypothetical protein [Acidobacteriaceae bacterium]